MNYGLEGIIDQIDIFLLILVRITAFFTMAPIFARRGVPNILKIGLAMIMSIMLASTMEITLEKDYNNLFSYFLLVLNEFFIGLTLSYITYTAFLALYISGQIIDMQIGFGMVNVIDPQTNIQVPVTANLFNVTAMLAFLAINGHHLLISSIFYSFRILPLGGFKVSDLVVGDIVGVLVDSFVLAFKIAAPVVAVIFLINIILGILARTVPQMNVFFVGMPLKIFVGICVLLVTMPLFSYIMDSMFEGMFINIETILKDMVR